MSWLRMIIYSISRLFKDPVSDEEFVRDLQSVLMQIIPAHMIDRQAGITTPVSGADSKEWYEMRTWAYREYLLAAQDAHNRLIDIKPKRQHGRLHAVALTTSKAYLETIWAYSVSTELMTIAWTDEVIKQHRKSEEDAQQWDQIAHKELVQLVELLRSNALSLEIPKELETISERDTDDYLMGMLGGHFITV